VDAVGTGDHLQVGAEGPHRGQLLGREGVGGDDPQRMARHRTDERQRRPGLTVQDHRAPARALYAGLGFVHDVSFVGYRSVSSG